MSAMTDLSRPRIPRTTAGFGLLYLPGLDLTHSLVLGAAWQVGIWHTMAFPGWFPLVERYTTDEFLPDVAADGQLSIPLLYPDAGLANNHLSLRYAPIVFMII